MLSVQGGRTIVWITHEPVGMDRMDLVLDLGRDSSARAAARADVPGAADTKRHFDVDLA